MTVLDNQNNKNYQNGYLIYNKDFIFKGKFLSKDPYKIAEICFNTSMTGYQKILTNQGPFLMADPGIFFILLRADRDLLWLAQQLGEADAAADIRALRGWRGADPTNAK